MAAATQNSQQDGYWEPENGPFIKLNRFYQRHLKEALQITAIQHCMTVFVLDRSVGWHERTARISNQEFAEHARVSVSSIVRNKQKLANLGLLVVLEQGTGKITTELTLDFGCEIDLSERANSLGISKEQLISDIQAGRIKQTDRPISRAISDR